MFIPYRVDVPFDHRPIVNWIVVAGVILVFCLQLPNLRAYSSQPVVITADPNSESGFTFEAPEIGGITGRWLLKGWGIKGIFGHMWLHGGVLHLVGNLIFLWLFGNAVCSKIGNILYLPIYILCGLSAAVSHLLFFDVPMLGASGAINGMVGMYLVFFPENSISCLFLFFRPYWFTVRSFWMILLWFGFDIWGALQGGGGVAYLAHIGGFASGFALAVILLKTKLVVMEKDEKSLFQLIGLEKEDAPASTEQRGDMAYWQLQWGEKDAPQQMVEETPPDSRTGQTDQEVAPAREDPLAEIKPPGQRFIRFRCRCGQKVKIASKYAGLTGRCPKCSGKLRIPSNAGDYGA